VSLAADKALDAVTAFIAEPTPGEWCRVALAALERAGVDVASRLEIQRLAIDSIDAARGGETGDAA
jgi:hypothetical protein